MTYNKKQMQPLIDKFQINPETNKLFIKVVEMFDGQPNYQIWAVKAIFNKAMTFDELSLIHDWAEKNQPMIKNLDKQNIVSYSTRPAIIQLQQEMRGCDMINIIKDVISHFNTDQRKMLTESILPSNLKPLEAFKNSLVINWADIFSKFNRLPSSRKNNFYTKASSIRDTQELQKLIIECLEATYTWDKDDMIAYMENNAKDCEVVFNQGPYVIVHVPSFESSKKLCGGGRTQWCITMESNHFRDYVTPRGGEKNDQFFFFDFSRKETDCFAHIGFTVKKGQGIIYAQTCDNKEMLQQFNNNGEKMSIHDVLSKIGAKLNNLIRLPKNKEFDWTIVSILEYVQKNTNTFAVALEKDNRIIINVLSRDGMSKLINHTMISTGDYPVDSDNKGYVLLDLNLPYNDENAVIAMSYAKDQYGSVTLKKMSNLFGKDIIKDKYLNKIGITQDDYLNREAIDPGIMLHKLIDEGDEKGAIKLIEKEGKDFNVNYEFNMRVPIFSVVNGQMNDLFNVIINHPKFDPSFEDGFGDSILQTLVYIYSSDDVTTSKDDKKNLEKMIKSILNCKGFNYNIKDINNDTALNITCEYPTLAWVTEELVKIKSVDINAKNDFGNSPLASAIRNKNIEAIKALGKRPDLVIDDDDKALAKSENIDLTQLIKPTEDVFSEIKTLEDAEKLLEFAMTGNF